MDLSSASDQPSGVRRRLSSRKAAQLRSLFCSGTPTARLETESDDAVLLRRKISRSEGRIAAVHPPASRRERKKSVIIIPLPAACIVSSSIIFLLLFLLFLALVSEAQIEVYRGGGPWKIDMAFDAFGAPYNKHLKVNKVSLFVGYDKGTRLDKDFISLVAAAGLEKEPLLKLAEFAARGAKKHPQEVTFVWKKDRNIYSEHVHWVTAIAPSEEEKKAFGGLDVGTAILVLWKSKERQFNPHHLGVVFVSDSPGNGTSRLTEGQRKKAVELAARNAFSLILHYNQGLKPEELKERIDVYTTRPIFEMPFQTMKGYNEAVNYDNKNSAPVIDLKEGFVQFRAWLMSEYRDKLKQMFVPESEITKVTEVFSKDTSGGQGRKKRSFSVENLFGKEKKGE